MSQENVEIVRRGYEHWKRTGDVLGENFHPDYVLDMSNFRGWPDRQTYRGVEGLRAFLTAWLDPWDDYEFEVEELHDAGDKVVAVLHESGRSKAGVPVEQAFSQVLTFRDGKQIRAVTYASRADALEAAGLRE
jgi:ketosteroid isomerase-like protein